MSQNNIMNKSKNTRKNKRNSRLNSNPRGNTSYQFVNSMFTTRKLSFLRAEVFPASLRTTCTYYEQVNFTALTTPQVYIFRGNGPFDPNQTGTGLQPVGYDNLSTFYDTYYVIGSRIRITTFNLGTVALQFSISPTTGTAIVSSYNDARIYPGSKVAVADGINRGGQSFSTLTTQMSTLQFFNVPYDKDFESLVTTNPQKQWYWTMACQSSDQATAITASFQYEVDYDLVFFGRKLVNLS